MIVPAVNLLICAYNSDSVEIELERVNGLEPSTCTLARYRSTN